MTFQQLTYLLEVHRMGSISRAAENLYLTQSSMSAAISAVETELGFPVFTRGRNGVTVTPQGERVVIEASKILESYRNMTQAETVGQRRYRIGAASYGPFNDAYCRLVQEMGHTGIFSQQAYSASEAARCLANYTLDVAVLLVHSNHVGVVKNTFRERELQVEKLGTVPVMIHIGPGHRLYNAQEVLPGDLEKEMLVDYPHMPMLNNSFLRSVFTFDRRRVIISSSGSIKNQLLTQGSAYAVGAPLPEKDRVYYRLRSIPVEGVDYTVLMATNPHRALDDVILRYMELIRETIAK